MIGTSYHVEIDGVKYQVNQVAENPYTEFGEPLRSPASQVVTGEEGQFNMRQDVLRFRWADWSGGQGANKFDRDNPGMYWRGMSIDGWSRPGLLMAGPGVQFALNSSGNTFTFTDASPTAPILREGLMFLGTNGYIYNNLTDRWGAAVAITGATTRVWDATYGNGYFWLLDNNSIIRATSDLTAFTDWATGLTVPTSSPLNGFDNHRIVYLAGKLYVIEASVFANEGVKVTEYLTSGTPPLTGTIIYEDATIAGFMQSSCITSSHNRVYFSVNSSGRGLVFEVVPSTSASAGYARIVASMDFSIYGMHWVDGILYIAGIPDENFNRSPNVIKPEIRYYAPSAGTYGVVGKINPDELAGSIGFFAGRDGRQNSGYMTASGYDGAHAAWFIDTITGAIHPWAYLPLIDDEASLMESLSTVDNGVMISSRYGGNMLYPGKLWYLNPSTYQGTNPSPYCISSSFDLGVSDDKILSSFVVSMEEAVPTNWRVDIAYLLDDDTNWTTAGSLAAGVGSAEILASSFAQTLTFSSMRIVVQFVWLGAGAPTTTPVLQYVEARAQLPNKVRAWVLELDLSDDVSDVDGESLSGAAKANRIRNLGLSGDVVLFRDGFSYSEPGLFDTYSVVLDTYQIQLAKSGEGSATVRLVERV